MRNWSYIFLICLIVSFDSYSQGFSKTLRYDAKSSYGWGVEQVEDRYIITSLVDCLEAPFYNGVFLFESSLEGELIEIHNLSQCDSFSQYTSFWESLLAVEDGFVLSTTDVGGVNPEKILRFDSDFSVLWELDYEVERSMLPSEVMELSSGNLLLTYFVFDDIEFCHMLKLTPEGEFIDSATINLVEEEVPEVRALAIMNTELTPEGDEFMVFADIQELNPRTTRYDYYITYVDTNLNVTHRLRPGDLEGIPERGCDKGRAIGAPLRDDQFVLVQCKDTLLPVPPLNDDHASVWSFNRDGSLRWTVDLLSINEILVSKFLMDDKGDVYGVGNVDYIPDETYGNGAGLVFKISNEGELLWRRSYFPIDHALWQTPFLLDFEFIEDGGLICTGLLEDDVDDIRQSVDNVWLLKLDSNGCLTPGCQDSIFLVHTSEVQVQEEASSIMTVRSPSMQGKVHVIFESAVKPKDELVIYSIDGRLWHWQEMLAGETSLDIQLDNYQSGPFIVLLKRGNRILDRVKGVMVE